MKYTSHIITNGVCLKLPTANHARKPDLYMSLISFIGAAIAFYYIYTTGLENLESFVPIIFLLGGIVVCIVFLFKALFKGSYLKQFPEQIIFNNQKSVIQISHRYSKTKKIEIPFSNIHTIAPNLHIRSSGAGKDRRTSHWYSAAIYLKDGSVWELTEDSFSHMDYANDWIDQWVGHVDFSKNNSAPIPAITNLNTSKLSITNRGEDLHIKWQNNMPDNYIARLFPPFLALGFASFMGFMLMMSEGPDFETLMNGLKNISSLEEIPELLRGLMFVLPIWTAFAIWLFVTAIAIISFRLTSNTLTANKTFITYNKSRLALKEVGAIRLEYNMNSQHRSLNFLREIKHNYKSEVINEKVEIDNVTENASMRKFLQGDDQSPVTFFKDFITTIPEQIKQAKKVAEEAEYNLLKTINFDRFSPVDVYTIKQNISAKLMG